MFADALQDTATFKTITYSISAMGEETKNESALYTSIPCRLHKNSNKYRFSADVGKYENITDTWTILVDAQYNGANRGDRVTISGKTYTVIDKSEIKGRNASIHHVVYNVEEKL